MKGVENTVIDTGKAIGDVWNNPLGTILNINNAMSNRSELAKNIVMDYANRFDKAVIKGDIITATQFAGEITGELALDFLLSKGLEKGAKALKFINKLDNIDDVITGAKYSDEAFDATEEALKSTDEIIEEGSKAADDIIEGGTGSIKRPSWRQSELDATKDFPGYDTQKSFINGEEVPYGTKGSVRPDYYQSGQSVDIKNYNVTTSSGRSNLASNIEKQYSQRLTELPAGTNQTVMIDIRGQNVTDSMIESLYDDIMTRTNNGVEIIFKTN